MDTSWCMKISGQRLRKGGVDLGMRTDLLASKKICCKGRVENPEPRGKGRRESSEEPRSRGALKTEKTPPQRTTTKRVMPVPSWESRQSAVPSGRLQGDGRRQPLLLLKKSFKVGKSLEFPVTTVLLLFLLA